MSDSEAVRYRCFQNLLTGKYSVQSTDYYRLGDAPEQPARLERQDIELFIERPPDERTLAFDSLQAAVEGYDTEFGCPKMGQSLEPLSLPSLAIVDDP